MFTQTAMVVKRRNSPTTMDSSFSVNSKNSSSASYAERGEGKDQILPLYSERVSPGPLNRAISGSSVPTTPAVDDEHDDYVKTPSSSRLTIPAMAPILRSTSANISVASEPYPWGSPGNMRRNSHDDSDSYQASPTNIRNTLVFTAKKRKNPAFFLVAAFCVLGMFLYSKSHTSLRMALEQVTLLTEEQRQVRTQFRHVERDIRRLQRQMMELDVVMEDITSSPESNQSRQNIVDEMNALQTRLDEGSSQIGTLQEHLQTVSKHDAISKYGSGVIRVQLILDFPEDVHLTGEDFRKRPTSIVMEMAPLELMPHSVYMFLEMVDAKLFDGCSFILNAMHVVKAAPLPYDGSSTTAKVKSFAKKGLETVAFREYSTDYPHEKYTVGFAADGSPSFYINTQDNSDIHVGDPCFAKVISGFDTVRRLEEAPTRNGIWYRQRIGIHSARIL